MRSRARARRRTGWCGVAVVAVVPVLVAGAFRPVGIAAGGFGAVMGVTVTPVTAPLTLFF